MRMKKTNSGEYYLIWKQILQTDIKIIVWHTVRRVTNEIFGVKGLIQVCVYLHATSPWLICGAISFSENKWK